MIYIKGVSDSTIELINMLLGKDAIASSASMNMEGLFEIRLSNDVMLNVCGDGYTLLIRYGNVATLIGDDYVEISII